MCLSNNKSHATLGTTSLFKYKFSQLTFSPREFSKDPIVDFGRLSSQNGRLEQQIREM
jgi:hypothetical protein